jgi:hypothetical protein
MAVNKNPRVNEGIQGNFLYFIPIVVELIQAINIVVMMIQGAEAYMMPIVIIPLVSAPPKWNTRLRISAITTASNNPINVNRQKPKNQLVGKVLLSHNCKMLMHVPAINAGIHMKVDTLRDFRSQ